MIFCIVCGKEGDICDCTKQMIEYFKNTATKNSCLFSNDRLNKYENRIFKNIKHAEQIARIIFPNAVESVIKTAVDQSIKNNLIEKTAVEEAEELYNELQKIHTITHIDAVYCMNKLYEALQELKANK